MAAVVFLTLAFLICKAQSQIYGPGPIYPGPRIDPGPYGPTAEFNAPFFLDPYGTPTLPNVSPISQPTLSYNQPLNIPSQPCYQNQIPTYPNIINQPLCNSIPSISQSLFPNVLQQVTPSVITNPVPQCTATPPVVTTIVDNTLANSLANAIQLLIVSNLIENTLGSSSGCGNCLAQSLGLLDAPCLNSYEVVTPDFNPCAPVVTCEYSNLYANDIPCYQEPVVYQSPCVETPCPSNFGPGYGTFSMLGDSNSFGFDNCGSNPIFGIDTCSNLFGSPVTSSFVCAEPMVATLAPMAVEVPFPVSIPAQLRCNFGYLPTNVPCVSVNVEPLPFDGCQNFFGNLGNFNF